ncbi:hypothetical protein pVco5_075 [Vibrio phage pVco-5]|uniref:Uncharacterized protein n=1 Tax=Vibrio phage pVco-5 TaxID=1965485 RepID=A0A1W6JUW3_9CAUD|nr:hypothetical protein KNT61_gp076 [Vibrio phage pVco-5]ARM71064.1 hypothetical protein pVco5_075 [Vibrio phage pVco-5]
MTEQAEQKVVTVTETTDLTDEQRITLLGATVIFNKIAQDHQEGDQVLVNQALFASTILERIVGGSIPLGVFDDPEFILNDFKQSYENFMAQKQMEQAATTEQTSEAIN